MAVYRSDILDIDLENNGSLHRSFLNHSIGLLDVMGNRFGVRLFRNGEPVSLNYAACQGIFMAPDGNNYAIVGQAYTGAGENDGGEINVGWVQLPAICYAVEGQFTLAIKIVEPNTNDPDVVGTMRIIDGYVNNTGADNPQGVEPPTVPTWQEVLAVWELMQEAIHGSVRWDITQSLTAAQQKKARDNIDADTFVRYDRDQGLTSGQQTRARQNIDADTFVRYDRDQDLTSAQKAQARDNIKALHDATFYALGLYLDDQGFVCQKLNGEEE